MCCCCNKETQVLDSYLKTFSLDLKNYKVISFIPADGCYSCLQPTLEYSKNANHRFLLVISSISQKSIDSVIKSVNAENSFIVQDPENIAAESGLVPLTTPRYYLVHAGRIVKILDVKSETDKEKNLEEVKEYLSK